MAALDPIVSSATVFLIQAAVLLSASNTEFAQFSLAYSYVLLGQLGLSAIFGGPLITVLRRIGDDDERGGVGQALLRYQFALALIAGAAGVGAGLALGIPAATALLVVAGFLALAFRDALRSVLLAQLKVGEALRVAATFALCTAAALAIIYTAAGNITHIWALAALAIGAGLSISPHLLRAVRRPHMVPRETIRALSAMAVWSLPGAAVVWLQNSFYLTLLALNLNLTAVGEVSAARMAVMPILITTTGLLRLLQVHAARMLGEQSAARAGRLVRIIALAALCGGAVLAALAFFAGQLIPPAAIPAAYAQVVLLVTVWLLFAAATTARGAYSALYQAMGRYREIFWFNAAVLPVVLAGVYYAPPAFGLIGAVLPMAAGELILLGLLALRLRLRHHAGNPPAETSQDQK